MEKCQVLLREIRSVRPDCPLINHCKILQGVACAQIPKYLYIEEEEVMNPDALSVSVVDGLGSSPSSGGVESKGQSKEGSTKTKTEKEGR